MALDNKDLEQITSIIYKAHDDLAVSIARSFERFEERIDALETRLCGRATDVEDKIETCRQALSDYIGDVRADLREILDRAD